MEKEEPAIRTGEYARRGDYHKQPDPNWAYYSIYTRKMAWVERFIREQVPQGWSILDAGCGEGVLVERFKHEGYRIFGVDRNYSSPYVHPGDLCHLPYAAATFDLLLCLDVLEHLNLLAQPAALHEMARILRPAGQAVFTIPNLAHLASRWQFLRHGQLLRTADVQKHPGDRPIGEYLVILRNVGLRLVERAGIEMTLPRGVKSRLGPKLSERIMYWTAAPASLCFLNILVCRKEGERRSGLHGDFK